MLIFTLSHENIREDVLASDKLPKNVLVFNTFTHKHIISNDNIL